jgi:hypothetical protein
MGSIVRQRIADVKKRPELGLAWSETGWQSPSDPELIGKAGAMHAAPVRRADARTDCDAGSPAEVERAFIVELIEAYEEKRWPLGKVPGGKG